MKFPRFPALWRFSEMPSHPSGSKRFGGKYTDKDQLIKEQDSTRLRQAWEANDVWSCLYAFLPLYQHVSTVPSYSPDIRLFAWASPASSVAPESGDSWQVTQRLAATGCSPPPVSMVPRFVSIPLHFNQCHLYSSSFAFWTLWGFWHCPGWKFVLLMVHEYTRIYCMWPPPSNNCK